jgi:osmoprotectant transport system ATP-binding protein
MSTFAVEFEAVGKTFGQTCVLRNVTFRIENGQLVTLIGPSGCGKTTTLKMINRLIEPTEGRVLVEGTDVSKLNPVELRRNIGYVIQQIGLFPHMTIEENISLVPRLKGMNPTAVARRTEELLDLIGLDPATFRHRYPRELSGGQQQRIGVARALAADPSIILMDEPFSALDPLSREQLQDELLHLQSTVQKTIVFVTHDMDEALKIGDIIVLMRDGCLEQVAPPEQLLRYPKNEFVREFIGPKRFQSMSVFLTAQDVMRHAVTVRPSRGLAECVELMRRRGVNSLIVTDKENYYLGVLGAREVYTNYGNHQLSAADVMSRDAATISLNADISTVLSRLESGGHGFLPVLDEGGRVVGVITRSSVIHVISGSLQEGGTDDAKSVGSTV